MPGGESGLILADSRRFPFFRRGSPGQALRQAPSGTPAKPPKLLRFQHVAQKYAILALTTRITLHIGRSTDAVLPVHTGFHAMLGRHHRRTTSPPKRKIGEYRLSA